MNAYMPRDLVTVVIVGGILTVQRLRATNKEVTEDVGQRRSGEEARAVTDDELDEVGISPG